MRVKKIDYTVGAGMNQSKPYHPGERRKYGQKPQQEQGDFKDTLRETHHSEEEISEVEAKRKEGAYQTEGTRIGYKIAKSIKKK